MQVDQHYCKHAHCECLIDLALAESGRNYCSSYCEEAAAAHQTADANCRCGHAECTLPSGVSESAVGGG